MSAEETKSDAEPKTEGDAAAKPAKSKAKSKAVLLGSASLILVASGWALAVVAVPVQHAPVEHELNGPTLLGVSPPSGFHVNLAEAGGKHYLAVTVTTEVKSFDEAKVSERAADALYRARLSDAVLKTASRMTKSDLDNPIGKEMFRQELLAAFEAVLFPVHVGDVEAPNAGHADSGLRPGASIERCTMRGLYYEHALVIDAVERTIRLDAGPLQGFQGDETDLEVLDEAGLSVFVDLTRLEPEFRGEVPVGVLGEVSNVYFTAFLIQ